MKTKIIRSNQVDLSKCGLAMFAGKLVRSESCDHTDISDAKEYLVKYSGHWIFGYFTKQWYGWNFVWFGSAYSGLQLDALDEVWEIQPDNSK